MRYELRDATPEDRDFLWELHVATMKEYVAQTWGWNDDDQKRRFDDWVKSSNAKIVVVEGRPVCRLEISCNEHALLVNSIEILPEMQRRGLGTAIIRDILDEARSKQLPVRLTVLRVNPARALYERLGFVITGEDRERYFMQAN